MIVDPQCILKYLYMYIKVYIKVGVKRPFSRVLSPSSPKIVLSQQPLALRREVVPMPARLHLPNPPNRLPAPVPSGRETPSTHEAGVEEEMMKGECGGGDGGGRRETRTRETKVLAEIEDGKAEVGPLMRQLMLDGVSWRLERLLKLGRLVYRGFFSHWLLCFP